MTVPRSPGRTRRASRAPRVGEDSARPGTKARARASSDPAGIRLLVLDCDGVLTDGALLYGPGGEILQRFSVYDGYAVKCLQAAGVEVAILTGRSSAALMHRAQALGIRKVVQGAGEKSAALEDLARQAGLGLAQVGFVGDDILDLGAVRAAGWSAAPASARPEVKAEVSHVCEARGGEGAVREVAEILLGGRDAWPPPGGEPPAGGA